MLLSIKSIYIPANRQRKYVDPIELDKLARSIKDNGLFHPIVVRSPAPDEVDLLGEGQTSVLCVGGRRLAAHIMLGRTEIDCSLREALDPVRRRIVELEENLYRVNLTWQEETDARVEIAALYKQLHPDANIRQTADFVGVSAAQLSKDQSLAAAVKVDPSLKAATSKGSALRTAGFKATIRERIQTAENNLSSGIADLRQKLTCEDARERLKRIPDQSVDMVFSDLPYGIDFYENTKAGRNTAQIQSYYDDHADSAKSLIAELVPHFVRVVKPTGWIVLFMCYEWHRWLSNSIKASCSVHGRECGSSIAPPITKDCKFLDPELKPWIWGRPGKGNHGHWPELHASSRYEMIVVVNGGEAKFAKKPIEDILIYEPVSSGDRLHSMQKPHALCRELIERCTVVGECVLDVTMGSGAHLAAAADLGRDFIGCDSNSNMLEPALTLVGQYYRGGKK